MRLLLLLVVAVLLPVLQGCIPLVVAGAGVAALSVTDRRSTGAQLDDEAIEFKMSSRVRENFGSAQVHVNATSYNRRVLLTGEAISEEFKAKLGDLARDVPGVVSVVNEIQIASNSSASARSNDGLTTSNVKTRMFADAGGKFNANQIKVLTEANVVYLMGIVTPAEGDAAAEIARTSQGVQRVVKVFEYVDKAPELGSVAK